MKYLLIIPFLIGSIVSADAQVKRVDAVGITVKDMNRSLKFYMEVLNFRKVSDVEIKGESYEALYNLFGMHARVVRLQLGDEFIELTDYYTSGGRSIPENQESNDLSFQHIAIVVSDMEKAYQQLRDNSIEFVSTEPQTLPKSIPAAEGIKAFYFHDPDNHNLEIIYFPKGKGQAKWQEPTKRLFLGIDHTAIGVSNTESSHQFYGNLLGIERKGESFNKGTEQEHLNNVKGASLHITGYRSNEGHGVEFLEYLLPGPGKRYPSDTRSDDLWNWYTILIVDDIQQLFNKLKLSAFKVESTKISTIGSFKALLVRDPDGHALLIKELSN